MRFPEIPLQIPPEIQPKYEHRGFLVFFWYFRGIFLIPCCVGNLDVGLVFLAYFGVCGVCCSVAGSWVLKSLPHPDWGGGALGIPVAIGATSARWNTTTAGPLFCWPPSSLLNLGCTRRGSYVLRSFPVFSSFFFEKEFLACLRASPFFPKDCGGSPPRYFGSLPCALAKK